MFHLLTDVGLFTRFGQNYELLPLSDFSDPSTLVFYGRIRYSPEGTLWMMYNRELTYWRGEAFIRVPFEPDLSDESAPLSLFDAFRELYVYSDQDIWLTSTSFGVAHYNGDEIVHYTFENSGLPATYFSDIARDDRGRTWLNGGRVIAILTPPEAETPLINVERAERALYLFPNPACCHTQVRWQQPTEGKVTLRLYDLQGRLVRTIMEEMVAAGERTAAVARDDLPAGAYVLVLERAGERSTRRLIWE